MVCLVGHPETPCPFGNKGARSTREFCAGCVHYQPPPHITEHCALWDRDRILCLKPKAACVTCHECTSRKPGRPEQETVQTVEERRAYEAAYREKNRARIQANFAKFKAKHPTYFKDTMRKRRKREQGPS